MRHIVPKPIFKHVIFQETMSTLLKIGVNIPQRDGQEYPLFVALSGGADSVALLRVLLYIGFDCRAIHCNFHLRGADSLQDELFVKDLCNRLNVKLFHKDFDTLAYAREQQISVEMAARDLRYNYFLELVESEKIPYIAIGHHLGDNIETLIQHLAKGAGLTGLRSIPPQRDCFIRPLINCKESDLYDFLSLLKQSYCTDSTNTDTKIQRNFVRHEIVPQFARLNPSYEEAFKRTFENVRESLTLVNYALQRLTEEVTIDENKQIYDARKIASSPAPLSLLYTLFNSAGFSRKQLEVFTENLQKADPATLVSPTHRLERRGFKLFLSPIQKES